MNATCGVCGKKSDQGLVCAECNKYACNSCLHPEDLTYCKPCAAQKFIDCNTDVKEYIKKG